MSAGEKKPGPDAARLKELLERTGYEHCITGDLRKYGGPPPDWEGDHPGAGHEVFCGNIPRDVYEDKLIPMFEKLGRIWELRLMTEPVKGLNRGHCTITFVDKEAADEAVKQLNNYEVTPGKHLQVNIAKARLFVGNIPRNKSKEEIMEEFSKLSENLKDVIIYGDPDDPKKKNRGFALLDYPTTSDANIARRRIGNCLRIWQREIRVEWADHQTEPDAETLSKVKVLYVDNLKSYVTEEQLEEHFKPYGKIECVQKMRHHGFIQFEDRDDALKAMEALNGSTLAESEIGISFAKRPSDRTPGGAEAKMPGPNQARLKEILERTGYQLQHKPGQHQYGGPPPDWEGDQPGAGHEVFCRNIPRDVFEDELIPLFEKCGKIWVLRLKMDSVTHLNRGFCFITFADKEGADEAVKQLHNHEIRPGNCLKVKIASLPFADAARHENIQDRPGYQHEVAADLRIYGGPTSDRERDQPGAGHEVFCGNIPENISEDKLIPLFEKCGKVWELRLLRDSGTNLTRGYCFVTFMDKEGADEAVKQLDNYEIKPGKRLRVENIATAPTPDAGQFKENLDRKRYHHEVTADQQKNEEPPPDWEGAPPGAGHDVYCGNIPGDVLKDELISLFEQRGKILELRKPTDSVMPHRQSFCFITFANTEEAAEAVKQLDYHEIRPGKHLTVKIAKHRAPDAARLKEILDRTGYQLEVTSKLRKYGGPPPDWEGAPPGAGHEVFCHNLPKDVYEDELIPLFEQYGKIWELGLGMNSATHCNRGFCSITFVDKEGAAKAVKELHNYEIKPGKHLQVKIARTRIFVNNIPKCKSHDEILDEFVKLSENLKDVVISSNPDEPGTKNRGFAILDYFSNKDASLAMSRIGKGKTCVWGRYVTANWSEPQQNDSDGMSNVKVLFVNNLNSAVTYEQLKEHFKSYGTIENIFKLKHFAFVHFENRNDALKAMEALNGSTLAESKIQVSLAKPRPKNNPNHERLKLTEERDTCSWRSASDYVMPPGGSGTMVNSQDTGGYHYVMPFDGNGTMVISQDTGSYSNVEQDYGNYNLYENYYSGYTDMYYDYYVMDGGYANNYYGYYMDGGYASNYHGYYTGANHQ